MLDLCYRTLVKGGVLALNLPLAVRWQRDHRYSSSWSDYDPAYRTHVGNERNQFGKGRIEPLGFRAFGMMEQIGFKMREPIVWVKGMDDTPICSEYRMGCDSDPYMRPCHEAILLGSKEQWFHRGGTGRRGRDAVPFMDWTKDVWVIPPGRDNEHPCVFPVEIPQRLIGLFTHASDSVIMDPFAGVGTTCIAAIRNGRSFVGCEKEPIYHRVAEQRIRQELQKMTQGRLAMT